MTGYLFYSLIVFLPLCGWLDKTTMEIFLGEIYSTFFEGRKDIPLRLGYSYLISNGTLCHRTCKSISDYIRKVSVTHFCARMVIQLFTIRIELPNFHNPRTNSYHSIQSLYFGCSNTSWEDICTTITTGSSPSFAVCNTFSLSLFTSESM